MLVFLLIKDKQRREGGEEAGWGEREEGGERGRTGKLFFWKDGLLKMV